MNSMKLRVLCCAVVLSLFAVPAFADISVFVGYADSLRPSPFFPSPWLGGGGVVGVGSCVPNCDSGAIRIDNTGLVPLTISNVSAAIPTWFQNGIGNGSPGGIWFGSFPLVLGPGQSLILAQTSAYNFDTSDFGAGGLNSAANCDPSNAFAIANPAFCASIAPVVTVTIAGTPFSFTDSGQVLDTGGFDFVNANPCPVVGDTPGNCNESLQWRPIGTSGITNPGGGVPEPGTLALLGTGLLGLGSRAWKRFIG